MHSNGKYPVLTSEYESISVPGLYFAGALGHGKDYKRSAGGFIHGFRYTTRFLFRTLATKYFGAAWPNAATASFRGLEEWDQVSVGLQQNGCNPGDLSIGKWMLSLDGNGGGDTCGSDETPQVECKNELERGFVGLVDLLFGRINIASGPYQMVAILGDGVVFQCSGGASDAGASAGTSEAGGSINATYFYEMTSEHFNTAFDKHPRLFWHFGYGTQRQSLHTSRTKGTVFQVHLWYYPGDGDCTLPLDQVAAFKAASAATVYQQQQPQQGSSGHRKPRTKEVLRLRDSLHANWGTFHQRLTVGKWLHKKIARLVQPQPQPQQQQQQQDHGWSNPPKHVNANSGGASTWDGGSVDVTFFNLLTEPVRLLHGDEREWTKPANLPSRGALMPGDSFRVGSHERESWVAETQSGVRYGPFDVDVSVRCSVLTCT
jgi:hypothetical protein